MKIRGVQPLRAQLQNSRCWTKANLVIEFPPYTLKASGTKSFDVTLKQSISTSLLNDLALRMTLNSQYRVIIWVHNGLNGIWHRLSPVLVGEPWDLQPPGSPPIPAPRHLSGPGCSFVDTPPTRCDPQLSRVMSPPHSEVEDE